MRFTEGYINDVIVKKPQKYSDQRGFLVEIWRLDEQELPIPKMSYMAFRKPGSRPPQHEHKYQTDVFFFPGVGKFKVKLWDARENSDTYGTCMTIETGENEPIIIKVPPGVIHGYKVLNLNGGIVFNFPDKLYKGPMRNEEPDEIRWEEKEDSPYYW